MSISAIPTDPVLANAFCRHPTGRPIFVDTCQYARSWSFDQTGGGTGALATTTAVGQVFNAVIGTSYAFTSSGVNNGVAAITRWMGFPHNLKLGLEVTFGLNLDKITIGNNVETVLFSMSKYLDLVKQYNAFIAYNPGERKVTINKFTAEETVLDLTNKEVGYSTGFVAWQNMKMVADFNTLKWDRLYWNENEIDLSAKNLSLFTNVPVRNNSMNQGISVYDKPIAVQYVLYIGSIIVTIEP